MRPFPYVLSSCALLALAAGQASSQAGAAAAGDSADPAITAMVARLDLEKYKATVKGLTQFGDRRQGTDRNRSAVDWIEAQLRSYGCTNTERIKYDYQPPAPRAPGAAPAAVPPRSPTQGQGGSRLRGVRARTGVNTDSLAQKDAKLRALNAQPTTPGAREEVFCTKVGTKPRDLKPLRLS